MDLFSVAILQQTLVVCGQHKREHILILRRDWCYGVNISTVTITRRHFVTVEFSTLWAWMVL